MLRWVTLFLVPLMAIGLASCGGGDDDDDTAKTAATNGPANAAATDAPRTDSSNGTGTLSVGEKNYTLDMQTCEYSQGASKLTALAGTMKGEKNSDFSASGIEKTVAIAARFGESGYISVGTDMTVNGKSFKWEGDFVDPANPGKPVKGKFSINC